VAESVPIVIGAEVRGTEDFRGEVERVRMDPTDTFVTLVSVRPRHAGGPARLVPVEALQADGQGLLLCCTPKEFEDFPEDPEGRRR
jgi:hypothetical protein